MGENVKIKEFKSAADTLREQIRHTESDITRTVHTLEQRVSPRYLRRRGVRSAQRLAWQATAKLLDLAQRSSVQASLLGAGALWLILRNSRENEKTAAEKLAAAARKGGVARAARMLLRKEKEQGKDREKMPGKTPSAPGALVALAAAATKGFWQGLRSPRKTGARHPGSKAAGSGLATAVGSALVGLRYSLKKRRA